MLNVIFENKQNPITNIILAVDSYKVGHIDQIPKSTKKGHSNVVFRKPYVGESIYIDEIVVFGTQIVAAIFANTAVTDEMIDEAEIEITQQGYDFPREEWEYIRDLGYIPLKIDAIPEGMVVPVGLPVLTIENTDDRSAWLAGYFETWVQDIVWTMTTIASKVRFLRKQAEDFCIKTGTPTDGIELEYMIHNFGDRGAGGRDRAIMAGMAHALFFSGSDCLSANRYIKRFFNTDKAYLSSVDASEHATVCANSDLETKNDFGGFLMSLDMLRRAVDRANRGIGIPVVSSLIDTYDDERYVKEFVIPNYDKVCEIGGKLVQRPDSGDAIEKPLEVAQWILEGLPEASGQNEKGFKTLPPNLGVIQGDGLREDDFQKIFDRAIEEKLAASNFVFGYGGGMTNGSGRDDLSCSMKATGRLTDVDGWIDMQKSPKTDQGKKSLCGRITVIRNDDGGLEVAKVDEAKPEQVIMETIYAFGEDQKASFDVVRERARA